MDQKVLNGDIGCTVGGGSQRAKLSSQPHASGFQSYSNPEGDTFRVRPAHVEVNHRCLIARPPLHTRPHMLHSPDRDYVWRFVDEAEHITRRV